MKKAFLSSSLMLVFAAYVLYVRILGMSAPFVLTPEPDKAKVALTLPEYSGTKIPVSNSTSTTKLPSNSGQTHAADPVTAPPQTPTSPPIVNAGKFKNGSYVGDAIDAYYGNVQVKAIISGGKLTDVQFLDYPQDRSNSVRINLRAMPYLISEAIAIQDSNVDAVSGASFTSAAYVESLSSALAQAKI